MTKQEIFNKAVLGLAKQKFARSVRKFPDREACAYRGRRGLRCALGVLLRDSEVKETDVPSFAGETWAGSSRKLPARLRGHGNFLRELQLCHDASRSEETMKGNLRDLASREGLSTKDLPL